jgi:hypothetical protein
LPPVYPSSKRASHAAHLAHRASFVPTLVELKNEATEATKTHQDEAGVIGARHTKNCDTIFPVRVLKWPKVLKVAEF